MVGVGSVNLDLFFVPDEPSQRIGDGIRVGDGTARCPPRDVMKPHDGCLQGMGQEVAESPSSVLIKA